MNKNREQRISLRCRISRLAELLPVSTQSSLDLAITPDQFIIQNPEDVKKTYTFEKKLGEGSCFVKLGAFGVVYRATHNLSKNIRAIKMIKKNNVTADMHKQLLKEIKILKDMDHPNIVRLYEFFSDATYYYLVTELVEGGELFDEIQRQGNLSEALAASVMRQLLSTMAYCHKRGIVHRDLKPENILIEKQKDKSEVNIKVIDFGTAEAFSSYTTLRQTIGTAYYIAPEVLYGNYNYKCDIWSCGVILYILLSGYPPFNGRTDNEIMAAVKKLEFDYNLPIWGKISSDAKDLINRMLVYPDSERINADEALAHRWIQSKTSGSISSEIIKDTIINLKNFHVEHKLQQAALMYLATQMIGNQEKAKLKEIFVAIDKNADGKLSREELIKGYSNVEPSAADVEAKVDEMMRNLDIDHSGFIDYSEFIVALMDKKKMLSKENLKQAFDLFDKDGNGTLTTDEIRSILGVGKNMSEKVWEEIIREVDTNNDGIVSFEEFQRMMDRFSK